MVPDAERRLRRTRWSKKENPGTRITICFEVNDAVTEQVPVLSREYRRLVAGPQFIAAHI
jgi:hypothetical protein